MEGPQPTQAPYRIMLSKGHLNASWAKPTAAMACLFNSSAFLGLSQHKPYPGYSTTKTWTPSPSENLSTKNLHFPRSSPFLWKYITMYLAEGLFMRRHGKA